MRELLGVPEHRCSLGSFSMQSRRGHPGKIKLGDTRLVHRISQLRAEGTDPLEHSMGLLSPSAHRHM